MDLNLQALAHNKPALIGVGVAGAAGLYVLLRRKQTTGSTLSGAGTAAGYSPPTTYPDTSGTDLVQQWGQFAQNLQSDLARDFPGSGNGTGSIPPQQPTGTAPTPGDPVPVGPPPPPPPSIGAGQAVSRTTITSGESLAPVLAFFGMTQQQFEGLNPGITSTYYRKPGTGALAFSLPSPRTVNVAGGKGW